jgi:hypothetical protein
MIDEYGAFGGMRIARANTKDSEETCHNVNLSAANPTLLDPGLNPGRRGGKQPRVEEKDSFFYPEEGCSRHLDNVGSFLPNYTGWHPKRP